MSPKPKRFVSPNTYLIKDPELADFQHLLELEQERNIFTLLIEYQTLAALKTRKACLIVVKGIKNPDAFLVVPKQNFDPVPFSEKVNISQGQLAGAITIPDTFLFTANDSSESLALVARLLPAKPKRSR